PPSARRTLAGPGRVAAGEVPARQGAPHDHTEVVGPALRDQLVLRLPPDQRVVELRGGEGGAGEGTLVRHCGRVLEGAEVAGAGLAHEAARHQVVEGAQGLL